MAQHPGDEVARIDIVQYANGEIGIQGNVGDVTAALAMIDQAREAVASQLGYRLALDAKKIVLPGSAVDIPRKEDLYPPEYAGDLPGFGKPGFHTGKMG